MTYATLAGLVARYGEQEVLELTDREGAGAVDGSVVATALEAVDGIINGYLAARYAVPVTPVPVMLAGLAEDLAWHRLHGKSTTDTVRQAAEQAMRTLRDLADGRAVLPGAAAVVAGSNPAVGDSAPRYVAPERRLGPCQISDYLKG